jgi:hypothetical protein
MGRETSFATFIIVIIIIKYLQDLIHILSNIPYSQKTNQKIIVYNTIN